MFLIVFLLTANGLILASQCATKIVWIEMAVLLKCCISKTSVHVSFCTNIPSTKSSWEDFLWCSHYTLTNTRQRFTTLSKTWRHFWQIIYDFSYQMTYLGFFLHHLRGTAWRGVTAMVVVATVAIHTSSYLNENEAIHFLSVWHFSYKRKRDVTLHTFSLHLQLMLPSNCSPIFNHTGFCKCSN